MNRSARSWHWRLLVALGLLIPLSAGCDISPESEEDFELVGILSQATLDTTTTDHTSPSVSPDGTRILFVSDAYAKDKNPTAATDYVLVDMPPPGSIPELVAGVVQNPGWTRINLGQIPNDFGILFDPVASIKGEATWLDDGQRFVAVIQNDVGKERLYLLELGPNDGSGRVSVISVFLIDDVDFAAVGNRNSYFYRGPSVSADGQWLAYARYYFRDGNETAGIEVDAEYMAIFAYNFATRQVVRVTNGSTIEQDPSWSPSGAQVVFTSQIGAVGTRDLMRVDFNASVDADVRDWIPWEDLGDNPIVPFTDGRVRLTTTSGTGDWKLPAGSFNPAWMRDGRIIFTSTRRASGASERLRNLWAIGPDGGDPQLILFSRWDDAMPATANFVSATSDAASLIVFSTRNNRSADFLDQKQDLWVLRGF